MNEFYAELQVTSHFSFLRGASSCDELFAQAAALGIPALGLVDRNSLAGVVRAHVASKEHGIRLIVGCRLDLKDGTSLLVYPMHRAGYAGLCRLLSVGKARVGKGKCELEWRDVEAFADGLVAILIPDAADDFTRATLARHKCGFGDRAYMSLSLRRRPNDQVRIWQLSNLAVAAGVPTVVTNDVLFHSADRQTLQDVVTAIRHNVTIDELGARRERFGDRYLKPPAEMTRLFSRYPEAVTRSLEIARRCRFSLDEISYQYPEEQEHPDQSPQEVLEKLTWEGAAGRYPEGVPDKVVRILKHELGLIAKLAYAPYFLTVNSIVRFARTRKILCQGRGSAANSAVCFVLGITSIDPERNDLLFERFVSEERREPPDIDVDFEHERREEVIQWVYETYGRERAALCATVVRYRPRGALRDVGKALGLPEDVTKALSSQVWGSSEEIGEKQASEIGLNFSDRRLRLAMQLASQLVDVPRHLSQHPGGFVLTRDRLDEIVPIEPASMANRQVIEWDKDDVDALKIMKVDVLALGMLSCMRKSFDLLGAHKDIHLDLATIPSEDPRTYAMVRKADTLGVFQIESRAQMVMLPRTAPRTFYDLVIQVAIVRPGPIQGEMVHPYLRRRAGTEKAEFPKPELEAVLGKTLGVPLFQEQAMRVAIVCAGFTAGEADQLRRAMATFKHTGGVSKFGQKLIGGMVANGYDKEFAERTFKQLEGFGSYGFPESHAASFALIAYASAWMKCWHPEVFCCALLNSQPMGFYAPAQIVRDAVAHGVDVRPVCVNRSRWDCTLEPSECGSDRLAVRLGLRLVRGLGNAEAARLTSVRDVPFQSVEELRHRVDLQVSSLEKLAEADAFKPELGVGRRDALWALRGLRDNLLPLFAAASERECKVVPEMPEPKAELRAMTSGMQVFQDYDSIGLSLRRHPVSFLREDFERRKISTCAAVAMARDGRWLDVAGIVLVRQRPGSAKGVMFVTIEDETGVTNVVVWAQVLEKMRRQVLGATLMGVRGRVQREGEVVHLVAHHVADISSDLVKARRM